MIISPFDFVSPLVAEPGEVGSAGAAAGGDRAVCRGRGDEIPSVRQEAGAGGDAD